MKELLSMQTDTSNHEARECNDQFGGQEVKGQGHTRLK